jgi:PKD repeat protein
MAHAEAGGSIPVPNVQALAQNYNISEEQIPERYIRVERRPRRSLVFTKSSLQFQLSISTSCSIQSHPKRSVPSLDLPVGNGASFRYTNLISSCVTTYHGYMQFHHVTNMLLLR